MLDAVNVGLNDGAGKLFLHHRTRFSTSFQLCDASRDAAERFYVNRIKAEEYSFSGEDVRLCYWKQIKVSNRMFIKEANRGRKHRLRAAAELLRDKRRNRIYYDG